MNIICIIFDSLRKDCIGAYGKPFWGEVKTPNLDRFAQESLMFTRIYPESLPTLSARRAIYTGKRVYPFREGKIFHKGDFVGAPGWGPIPEEDDTVAEVLRENGYRTGFVSSVFHQFKPSKNYWRGFDQWHFVRGKENDPYKSGPEPTEEEINHYLPKEMEDPARREFIKKVIKNTKGLRREEDYPVAQVMIESARWLEENRDAKNFFLMVESFDPHEPWNVPVHYRHIYDKKTSREQILSTYSNIPELPADLLKRTRANYSGLVTMCDRWFGYLFESIKNLGLLDDTVVIVSSDHGHSLGDKNYLGKRGYPSSPEVFDIPLLIMHPKGEGTGKKNDILAQHHDFFSLMLGFSGVKYNLKEKGISGMDFWKTALKKTDRSIRKHATIGWRSTITVIDNEWWFNCRANGKGPFLYNLKKDPGMKKNVADTNREIVNRLFSLAVQDAGGTFPDYIIETAEQAEDIPGCSALAAEVSGL